MADRRCVLVDFSDFDGGIEAALQTANRILNRRELGWSYGETRPPRGVVVQREFDSEDEFACALAELRVAIGRATADEVLCESIY